eukprot:TRINITY_DN256_c0_g1_i2.p1 TRINITY_DN256_c0_g1~~TRINITY_DN256_c0_g1_i2.p1  ORF type:complete len:163 (+),score=15.56 TRINITY_DN256_c0_g1_i2:118-606(+)
MEEKKSFVRPTLKRTDSDMAQWIQLLIKQLPRGHPFRSFIFDDENIWVSVKEPDFKGLMRKACFHHWKAPDKTDTLWNFLNSAAKIDTTSIVQKQIEGERLTMSEFYFPRDLLPKFIGLVNQLSDPKPASLVPGKLTRQRSKSVNSTECPDVIVTEQKREEE